MNGMERNMTRLEVRCCCQPRRLLGWLEVPDPGAPSVVVPVVSLNSVDGSPVQRPEPSFSTFTLPLANLRDEVGHMRRAVKAEGMSIETLRSVPGFVEAMASTKG